MSLRKLNLRWKKINTIFISHTHADHVTGLPGMLMLSSQVDRDEPLYIVGPPKIREYVEENRRVLDMYINYDIVIREVDEPGVVYQGEGFHVEAFWLRHTKPCLGYVLVEDERPGVFKPQEAERLQVPKGPKWAQLQRGESVLSDNGETVRPAAVMGSNRPGRKVGYVTDTVYFDGIAPKVAGCDFLVCEGMFRHELEESAREKRHLTAHQAACIARDAGGVGQLGLIHYSPRYTEYELKQLLLEAREVFANTILTRDRLSFDIPYREE